jgi:hypothetical protein
MSGTLRESYEKLRLQQTFKMTSPFLVWLLENPRSPLALPGAISLDKHDFVHCLLGVGLRLIDEAYVIGFTMGCDSKMRRYHLWLFKIFSCFLYPRRYRFKLKKHWPEFMRGYELGRKSRVKDIEEFDFNNWLDQNVENLRAHFFGVQAQTSSSLANGAFS